MKQIILSIELLCRTFQACKEEEKIGYPSYLQWLLLMCIFRGLLVAKTAGFVHTELRCCLLCLLIICIWAPRPRWQYEAHDVHHHRSCRSSAIIIQCFTLLYHLSTTCAAPKKKEAQQYIICRPLRLLLLSRSNQSLPAATRSPRVVMVDSPTFRRKAWNLASSLEWSLVFAFYWKLTKTVTTTTYRQNFM